VNRMKERQVKRYEEIRELAESDKLKQTTIEVWGISDGENVAMQFVEKHGL
jgi:hypothetical protein